MAPARPRTCPFFHARGTSGDELCRMHAANAVLGEEAYAALPWRETLEVLGSRRGFGAAWVEQDCIADGGAMPIGLAVEVQRPWWITLAAGGDMLAALLALPDARDRLIDPALRRMVMYSYTHAWACRGEPDGTWWALDPAFASPHIIAHSDDALLANPRVRDAAAMGYGNAGVVFVARTDFALQRWASLDPLAFPEPLRDAALGIVNRVRRAAGMPRRILEAVAGGEPNGDAAGLAMEAAVSSEPVPQEAIHGAGGEGGPRSGSKFPSFQSRVIRFTASAQGIAPHGPRLDAAKEAAAVRESDRIGDQTGEDDYGFASEPQAGDAEGQEGEGGYEGRDGEGGYEYQDGEGGYEGQEGEDGYEGQEGMGGYDDQEGMGGYEGQEGEDGYDDQEGMGGYEDDEGEDGCAQNEDAGHSVECMLGGSVRGASFFGMNGVRATGEGGRPARYRGESGMPQQQQPTARGPRIVQVPAPRSTVGIFGANMVGDEPVRVNLRSVLNMPPPLPPAKPLLLHGTDREIMAQLQSISHLEDLVRKDRHGMAPIGGGWATAKQESPFRQPTAAAAQPPAVPRKPGPSLRQAARRRALLGSKAGNAPVTVPLAHAARQAEAMRKLEDLRAARQMQSMRSQGPAAVPTADWARPGPDPAQAAWGRSGPDPAQPSWGRAGPDPAQPSWGRAGPDPAPSAWGRAGPDPAQPAWKGWAPEAQPRETRGAPQPAGLQRAPLPRTQQRQQQPAFGSAAATPTSPGAIPYGSGFATQPRPPALRASDVNDPQVRLAKMQQFASMLPAHVVNAVTGGDRRLVR